MFKFEEPRPPAVKRSEVTIAEWTAYRTAYAAWARRKRTAYNRHYHQEHGGRRNSRKKKLYASDPKERQVAIDRATASRNHRRAMAAANVGKDQRPGVEKVVSLPNGVKTRVMLYTVGQVVARCEISLTSFERLSREGKLPSPAWRDKANRRRYTTEEMRVLIDAIKHARARAEERPAARPGGKFIDDQMLQEIHEGFASLYYGTAIVPGDD